MKKIFLLFIITLIITACNSKVNPNDLDKLNGYWEIESVETIDGETKKYEANTNVDYIEYKNQKGYRQKLVPLLDGTFQSNGLKEEMQLLPNEKQSVFVCKTKYAEWKEEIIELSDNNFSLKNEQGLIYHYKKFTPIEISKK